MCGPACLDEYWAATGKGWSIVRSKVLELDRGICLHCGCDCLKIRRVMLHHFAAEKQAGRFDWKQVRAFWIGLGWQLGTHDQWQADHIVPRVRGGRDELKNLRTLCIACHRIETARLAAELAAERRDAKAALFAGGMELSR